MVWGSELWVLSGYPERESVIAEGPEKGKKISEIWPGEFPLLIKFIDARDDLSIQVHPNDSLAVARHAGPHGKTEMWYVIGASEGAGLYSGLKQEITPEDYVRLVAEDKITDVLAYHKASPGDVFFLPAGRIHAICGGCYLAEIQQTSDLTYRIYDYNRLGLDGKPRELHTALAKDAIDYKVHPDYKTDYVKASDVEVPVVACRYFKTSILELTKPFTKSLVNCGDFLIAICLEGSGKVSAATGECSLKAGETVLVTRADKEVRFEGDGGYKLLLVTE